MTPPIDALAWLDESTPAFWRVSKMRHNELHALLLGLKRARDSWRARAIIRESQADLLETMTYDLDFARAEVAAARSMLLRIVGRDTSHVCAWCGMPATCFGGEAGTSVAFACDTCCGHGNEDSWCVPVEELGKVLR